MSFREMVIGFLAIMLIGGCSKKKVDVIEDNVQEPIVAKIEIIKNVEPESEPVEEPKKVITPNFENVKFNFDSYQLSNESIERLGEIAQIMIIDEDLKVTIYGAACPIGTYEYNLALGQHRALACQKYLVTAGIDPVRIACFSWGEDEVHLVSNVPDQYELNRRSEFKAEFSK